MNLTHKIFFAKKYDLPYPPIRNIRLAAIYLGSLLLFILLLAASCESSQKTPLGASASIEVVVHDDYSGYITATTTASERWAQAVQNAYGNPDSTDRVPLTEACDQFSALSSGSTEFIATDFIEDLPKDTSPEIEVSASYDLVSGCEVVVALIWGTPQEQDHLAVMEAVNRELSRSMGPSQISYHDPYPNVHSEDAAPQWVLNTQPADRTFELLGWVSGFDMYYRFTLIMDLPGSDVTVPDQFEIPAPAPSGILPRNTGAVQWSYTTGDTTGYDAEDAALAPISGDPQAGAKRMFIATFKDTHSEVHADRSGNLARGFGNVILGLAVGASIGLTGAVRNAPARREAVWGKYRAATNPE